MARALDASFGKDYFTLTDLCLDEQRKIAQWLLAEPLERYAYESREIYTEHQRLMHFLRDLNIHLPVAWRVAAAFTLNADLAQAARYLTSGQLNTPELMQTFHTFQAEAKRLEGSLDSEPLRRAFEAVIQRHVEGLASGGTHAQSALQGLEAAHQLNLGLNLWRIQNLFWKALRERQALLDPSVVLSLGTRLGFNRTVVEKFLHTPTSVRAYQKTQLASRSPAERSEESPV